MACPWIQRELAKRADASRPTVARIERGDDVSTAPLAKVAAVLGLAVALPASRNDLDVGGS
ncbi:helix-turn-helix transcriptional regulator [Microbacterium foliorum]|uniref:Helix-turn-helix transcriptional regulator n=1 Tax=Microbacterium foliorum TaxID=104336 RepID=A0A4Y5YUB8_9MICO|nr:helix-turn-helix transcriptional regulator [Microbacterium foliorum]